MVSNKSSLRQAIRKAGSQSALAKQLNVSRQRINNWLNRDHEIPYPYSLIIESINQGLFLPVDKNHFLDHARTLDTSLKTLMQSQNHLHLQMQDLIKTMGQVLTQLQYHSPSFISPSNPLSSLQPYSPGDNS